MSRISLVMLAWLLGLAPLPAVDFALPEDRLFREAWRHAGLPSGMVHPELVVAVTDFGTKGDGETDDGPAIIRAIASLEGVPGVVYFPPGTYLVRSPVEVPSGVVLRGSGPQESRLIFDFVEHALVFAGRETGDWIPFAQDGFIHDRQIRLTESGGVSPDDYALLTQEDDPAWGLTDTWGKGSAGQVVKIVAVDNGLITLERPLRHDYPLVRKPSLRRIQPVTGSGLENLGLERLLAGDNRSRNNRYTVLFRYAVGCWMRGVHARMAFGSHVSIDYSTQVEITGCYFDDAHEFDGGGSGYGVRLQFRSGECLIQDNIFRRLRHAILLQAGANGNVIAYNYVREGFSMHHPGYASDISLHGNYPYANLFEGNSVGHIWIDHSHKTNGPLNTFFRNRADVAGFNISDPLADRQNIIGNEFFRGNWIARMVAGHGYSLKGRDHFSFGNLTQSRGLQPPGTSKLPAISLYLDEGPNQAPLMPAWWTLSEKLPVIGLPQPLLPPKNIPARERWLDGKAPFTVPAPAAPASGVGKGKF